MVNNEFYTVKFTGNKPNHVGYQMMWGGAAWGLVAVGTSYIVDMLSEGKPTKDFTYPIYVSAVLLLLNAVVGLSFDIKVTLRLWLQQCRHTNKLNKIFNNKLFTLFSGKRLQARLEKSCTTHSSTCHRQFSWPGLYFAAFYPHLHGTSFSGEIFLQDNTKHGSDTEQTASCVRVN